MYSPTNWIARVGTALNRFLKSNEVAASVELTNDPTGITTAGTPFTVANMNNIETGIKDNDDRSLANVDRLDVVEGTGTPQGVGTEDDVSFGTVNTGQGANELYDMDQNVKTTDDVEFDDINATGKLSTTAGLCSGIFTFETITKESGITTDGILSDMNINEIKIVNLKAINNTEGGYLARFYFPSTGTYKTVGIPNTAFTYSGASSKIMELDVPTMTTAYSETFFVIRIS